MAEALVAALCDSSNAAVRDTAAGGLAEFLQYGIKQSSKEQMSQSSGAVQSLLQRVLVLAAHPADDKRLGAALFFGKTYKALREETSLVHRYALKITHSLLQSLRFGGSGQRQQECNFALQHYVELLYRSVVDKDDRAGLLQPSSKREWPQSLGDLVDWLWENLAHVETVRHLLNLSSSY